MPEIIAFCKLYFLVFFGLSAETVFAQPRKISRNEVLAGYVFKGNHLQFSFAPLSLFPARVKRETGSHPVSTKNAPGFLFSVRYLVNFNNDYSLITGPEATLLGRNLFSSFDKDDFTPALTDDYELRGNDGYVSTFVISLPVLIEKRWLYSGTEFFYADAGVRLNVSTGADFDLFSIYLPHIANGFHNAGGTDVYANNNAKPWLSFPLNAGHAWLMKNNNVLQLGIISNISFTNYVNGNYKIVIPSKPITSGRYSSTGSYVGLSLNYVFTNANYRIRRVYENRRDN